MPLSELRLGSVFSEIQAVAARASPCKSQSYDDLKVRFSATLGEEPEVEVGERLGARTGLTEPRARSVPRSSGFF